MGFARIGRLATRYRLPIIGVWIAAAVIITAFAPNIEHVASSDTSDFLPNNAPFRHADDVYAAAFPGDGTSGGTVIVIDARGIDEGVFEPGADTFEAQIDTTVGRFIDAFAAWSQSDAAPETFATVDYPTMNATAAALMVASDSGDDPALANQVALIRVSITASPTEEESVEALETIDAWLAEHRPAGVQTYQTGASPIVNDTTSSIKTSVDRTIWVTVVLVILMLLMVYRSPVSPLIPLAAVTVAYLITRGIVAWLG
ncbi:MAG: MMPL family transporter, partial [Anaerolineae bacterium]|nr:MMPL family transporter [Anaerolineae bacterium]